MDATDQNPGPWCIACGYCLHGLPATTEACPECGGSLKDLAIRIPRAQLSRRLIAIRLAASAPASLFGLLIFLFLAPCTQRAGAYRYVGDWPVSPGSRSAYWAIVSANSSRTVLGCWMTWPIHIAHGPITVGTRYASFFGVDPQGNYELEINSKDLTCRLILEANGQMVRNAGTLNEEIVGELLVLNTGPPVPPEQAKLVFDAVQAIAAGSLLPEHFRDVGPVNATAMTWVATAVTGFCAWLVLIHFGRRAAVRRSLAQRATSE